MPPHVSLLLPSTYTRCKLRGMTLDEYLRDHETAEALAVKARLSAASISRIRNRTQDPSAEAVRRIVSATNGKVTADALLGIGA